ncbi:hypothetical protein [uncultured Draconibacterium sp.]|uniref:hypothetical protein n=1 Tax=uncultured Draconibacterium sp. TaxID=1573823 RepID=UPI0032615E68
MRNTLSFVGGCSEYAAKLDSKNAASIEQFYGNNFISINSLANKNHPPVATIALAWMELLEQEDQLNLCDYDNRFVLSTPGYRGIAIEGLGKETEYYSRLLLSVKKARDFSNKQGKSFGVPCLFWVQGEANIKNTTDEYFQKLKQLFQDLNKDIKAITHQKKDVVFISYQTAPVMGEVPYPSVQNPRYYEESGSSFAQLKLAKEQKNVYMGGAMYQYQYRDIWHPTDRAVVGIQLGIAAKRIISDKKKLVVFSPLKHKIKRRKNEWDLLVKFDVPVPPLRFDTSKGKYHNLNGKQKNYGFTLTNENGEDILINEPVIMNENTLVFVCKEKPKKAVLSYATNGHYGGGNLCDSQNIKIYNKNTEYLIDNFCPAFDRYVIK